MASSSPPPSFPHNLFTQHSPPYPPNAQLPQLQQRRQSEMSSSVKKRKMSMASATSSSHPLRQSTLPPDADAIADSPRSPSVETMSMASASVAGGGQKKKRRRKGKSKAADDDDESVVAGKAKSAVSGASGGRKRKTSVVSGDEDEEDEGNDMTLQTDARTEEEDRKEAAHRAVFVAALDPEQLERYTAYRQVKLPDATVRRIVNQTLSQSVPANVILAIKSAAKVYIGDVIEEARRVQAQWNYTDEALADRIQHEMNNMPVPAAAISEEVMNEEKRLPIGPLEPDHLREAVRRLKISGEQGSVGQLGLFHEQHQSGVERFASKAGGKRLFK